MAATRARSNRIAVFTNDWLVEISGTVFGCEVAERRLPRSTRSRDLTGLRGCAEEAKIPPRHPDEVFFRSTSLIAFKQALEARRHSVTNREA